MGKLHSEAMDKLFEGILTLESVDECYSFFEDLCTIKELQDISQRFVVAELLRQGKNYQEIFAETKVSMGTIGRVNKSLLYGSGGYAGVLEKLENK